MKTVNIVIEDYQNAPNGSLLIKNGNSWKLVLPKELNKDIYSKLKDIDALKVDFRALAKNNEHFIKYAKSHFLVVFNSFKIKVLMGEIEGDESLFNLDEEVLSDNIKVEDAIEKHPYLKETFTKLYLSDKETIVFPEV